MEIISKVYRAIDSKPIYVYKSDENRYIDISNQTVYTKDQLIFNKDVNKLMLKIDAAESIEKMFKDEFVNDNTIKHR